MHLIPGAFELIVVSYLMRALAPVRYSVEGMNGVLVVMTIRQIGRAHV